jgi:hypothetical protein
MAALGRRLRENRRDGKAGLVDPDPPSRPGRRRGVFGVPPVAPQLLPVAKRDNKVWTLAVDIGGTGIKASVLDERGALLAAKVRVSTPVGEPPLVRSSGRSRASRGRFRGSTAWPWAFRAPSRAGAS